MGAASYKNEIKILFLVINSCIALTIGLFPLSFGLTMVLTVSQETTVILGTLVVGTLILSLVSLGHYGAILEKRTALRVYAAVMGLVTFAGVMAVTKFSGLPGDAIVFLIFHTAVTLSAATLATVLAKLARRTYPVLPSALVATPTAPTAL